MMTETRTFGSKARNNGTDYIEYIRIHRDDFRNAAMVRDCKGAISYGANDLCSRCGFPTVKVEK